MSPGSCVVLGERSLGGELMNASSRALLVICLALGLAPAAGGCGGHESMPSDTADSAVDSAVDGPVDTSPDGDASLISPACMDDAGNCIYQCLVEIDYADVPRNCYEQASLCVEAPIDPDAGPCGSPGCFVNLADGGIITVCVTPSSARWRPCTAAEHDSIQSLSQVCPPPPVHGGQVFF